VNALRASRDFRLLAIGGVLAGLVGLALAFNFGAAQLTGIVGPALGGLTIATFEVGAARTVDVVSCLALVAAGLAIGPQDPTGGPPDPTIRSSPGSARASASSGATTPSSAAS